MKIGCSVFFCRAVLFIEQVSDIMKIAYKHRELQYQIVIHIQPQNGGKVAVMHILAFILLFVMCSIGAACNGDYSGLAVIGKVIGFFALLIGMMFLFTQPVLLFVVIVIIVIVFVALISKS